MDSVARNFPEVNMKKLVTLVLLSAFSVLSSLNWACAETEASGKKPAVEPDTRQDTPASKPHFEYAAKFVCGTAEARASVLFRGKTYYIVDGNDPDADSGSKVCAAVGKTCAGYNVHTNDLCKQLHPTA